MQCDIIEIWLNFSLKENIQRLVNANPFYRILKRIQLVTIFNADLSNIVRLAVKELGKP
jgi:hypothetical protein